MKVAPVIWVEGLMGAGKSTLAENVSKALDFETVYEPVDNNPYLAKFYEDPYKYAFAFQIYMLHVRFNMQNLAASKAMLGQGMILDRGLPGDRVFCRMLIKSGHIPEDFWLAYETAYEVMSNSLRPPSLLIYLDVKPEEAIRRISTRGRDIEKQVPLSYLQDMQRGYEEMLEEVTSGKHPWARGITVHRVDWNTPNQSIERVLNVIGDYT